MKTIYKNIIARFKNKKILVIGDLILDQYIRGTVSRISPEAPVPIVLQEGIPILTPGGSANVAHNLRSLGAQVTLAGRVGKDAEGTILLKALKKQGVDVRPVIIDTAIPTPLKTRIAAQHQQVLRLDREKPSDASNAEVTEKILRFVRHAIEEFDAVIISDYGKGTITAALVFEVCQLAIRNKKIITVDPKVEHFSYYRGVTSITPNRKETENAIRDIKIAYTTGKKLPLSRDRLETDAQIDEAGCALVRFLNLESLLLTLGEKGMRLFERTQKRIVISHIDTRARDVFDVTGAGDTVISVFTLSLTAGASKHQAADLANYAAGIVVGKMGVVVVTPKELGDLLP